MTAFSDYYENLLIDGIFRGGAMNSSGTLNSAAVVYGIWTASTSYTVGQIVVPHANMTGAGGKLLQCVITHASGTTNTLAVPAVGSTMTDNGSAMWLAISVMPCLPTLYAALITCTNGARTNSYTYSLNNTIVLTANDGRAHYYKCTTAGTTAASQGTLYAGTPDEAITDGTAVFTEQSLGMDAGTAQVEVSGGSYARQAITNSLANWAGTQSTTSTTYSTGTGGTTSNNAAITFSPPPTANWSPTGGAIAGVCLYDQLTSGNLITWGILTTPKTVNNGDAAPSFAISAFTFQVDNG